MGPGGTPFQQVPERLKGGRIPLRLPTDRAVELVAHPPRQVQFLGLPPDEIAEPDPLHHPVNLEGNFHGSPPLNAASKAARRAMTSGQAMSRRRGVRLT